MSDYPDYLNEQNYYDEVLGPPPEAEQINSTIKLLLLIRNIEGYDNYMVSNYGQVFSKTRMVYKGRGYRTKKGQWMKLQKDSNGYPVVMLGAKNTQTVHRLVAKAFLPNPFNFNIVNHIDGNKQNNRADNLEWCDFKHNYNHAISNNLSTFGLGLNRKFDEEVARQVQEEYKKGILTQRQIAGKYRMSQTQVRRFLA